MSMSAPPSRVPGDQGIGERESKQFDENLQVAGIAAHGIVGKAIIAARLPANTAPPHLRYQALHGFTSRYSTHFVGLGAANAEDLCLMTAGVEQTRSENHEELFPMLLQRQFHGIDDAFHGTRPGEVDVGSTRPGIKIAPAPSIIVE
jgi:hypothetical protein